MIGQVQEIGRSKNGEKKVLVQGGLMGLVVQCLAPLEVKPNPLMTRATLLVNVSAETPEMPTMRAICEAIIMPGGNLDK